jgi:hypothetical protein
MYGELERIVVRQPHSSIAGEWGARPAAVASATLRA